MVAETESASKPDTSLGAGHDFGTHVFFFTKISLVSHRTIGIYSKKLPHSSSEAWEG